MKSSTQQAPYVTSPITMVSASVNLGRTRISGVMDHVHVLLFLTVAINTVFQARCDYDEPNKINPYLLATERVHNI